MTSAKATAAPRNRQSTVVVASLVGTSIEFYDFYIYGTAAVLVFPGLFFPNDDPVTAQLASLLTFALAFLARPVGSVLFGHFGDRIGRKKTLVVSLIIMGAATLLIGCLPTYSQIGLWAPVLLATLRLIQGIGLGGEWSGAALLAIENAPAKRRGLFGSFPQLGAPIGFILANGVFLLLTLAMPPEAGETASSAFQSYGWRIPFLLSGVLVIVGLYVRLALVETPVFANLSSERGVARIPIGVVFRRHWRSVVLGTFACVATYVLFYLLTTFALGYGTSPRNPIDGLKVGLGYDRSSFLILLLVGTVFFGLATPVAGRLADRFGRRKLLLVTTALIFGFGFSFEAWLGHQGSIASTQTFLIAGLLLMGLSYGPMGSFLPELFPTEVRYTGSAIVYNLGSVLGASFAPAIALGLWKVDGDITAVGLYLSLAAAMTAIALALLPETRLLSLDSHNHAG